MAITSNVSTLGVAKEAVVGTAVAPTASIPITALKPTPKINYLEDQGYRGSAVKTYNVVTGSAWQEYEFDGPVYVDTIGWVLAGLLNDLSTTGASDPFTTTFSVLNSGTQQPTTYTLTDYNGNNTRAYAGTVFDKLDLTYTADALLTYTAHGTGISFATASNTSTAYSAVAVVPNYKCTATIGGASNVKILDGSLSIQRTSTPILTLGAQNPTAVFAGGDIAVTGALTLLYDTNSETVLLDALNGTAASLTLDWVQAATRELILQMSNVIFQDPTFDRAQGGFVKLPVKFTANANTTDIGASGGYSPIKATTKSQIASGTYK